MRIDVVTIFPQYLDPLRQSLPGKAIESGIVELHVHDLRRWTHDVHRSVAGLPTSSSSDDDEDAQHRDKIAEGKAIVSQLATLKYELQHDRVLREIVYDGDGDSDNALYDRAVRVVILSAGLVFGGLWHVLPIAVYVLAGLSIFTVLQRIWHVRKQLTREVPAV